MVLLPELHRVRSAGSELKNIRSRCLGKLSVLYLTCEATYSPQAVHPLCRHARGPTPNGLA